MANINLLTKNMEAVPCIHPVDFNTAATTGDYIDMANYDSVLVCCYAAALGAATTITIEQCLTDGGAAIAIGSGKTITVVANSITTVNIKAAELTTASNYRWLKITGTDPGVSTLGCVFVVGYNSRYAEATMPSLV